MAHNYWNYDFVLLRENKINNSQLGHLIYMKTGDEWCTLENAQLLIDSGDYHFRLRYSPSFHYDTPYLFDVVGREWILMHRGNYASDSRGCILIGEEIHNDRISHSARGFERLMKCLVPGIEYSLKICYQLF